MPDAETAIALTADQLGRADFSGDGDSDSPHRLLATLSSSAIVLAKRWLPGVGEPPGLLERLGSRTVVAATVRAIQLLGRQFVLGRHIDEALDEAAAQRREAPTLRFSFDMLGEGARTERDALRYLAAYDGAIRTIARAVRRRAATPRRAQRDGISIKLSALHARYEDAQRERVMRELVPRLVPLLELAAAADINLTIDAEESDRLELSLEVFDALAAHVQQHAPRWTRLRPGGAGLSDARDRGHRRGGAHRARAPACASWCGWSRARTGMARSSARRKAASTAIRCSRTSSTPTSPTWPRARALLAHHDVILPQFATHNAGTIAAIVQMARAHGAAFEMQRLHGMGEGVYREVLAALPELKLRVYAPVGEHRDLLAYLVRRLLENGANSSFVHQLVRCRACRSTSCCASPLQRMPGPGQPLPRNLYGPARINPHGVDLACIDQREPLLAAWAQVAVPSVREADAAAVDAAMQRLRAACPAWNARPVHERAHILELAAERLEARLPQFCALLVAEGRKTWGDCVSEVREAIDFCRYYALRGPHAAGADGVAGPHRRAQRAARCTAAACSCASRRGTFRWRSSPARWWRRWWPAMRSLPSRRNRRPAWRRRSSSCCTRPACRATRCSCCTAPARSVGAKLVAHPLCAGVCFTGSTQVAKHIQRALAARRRTDRAADRRDRRLERDGGRLHRAARAGGRCGGAERVPLGRVSAARHCACCACTRAIADAADRDAGRRDARAARRRAARARHRRRPGDRRARPTPT